MPLYKVAYEMTYMGFTVVNAPDAEEARALVDDGEFVADPKHERTDWKALGNGVEVTE